MALEFGWLDLYHGDTETTERGQKLNGRGVSFLFPCPLGGLRVSVVKIHPHESPDQNESSCEAIPEQAPTSPNLPPKAAIHTRRDG